MYMYIIGIIFFIIMCFLIVYFLTKENGKMLLKFTEILDEELIQDLKCFKDCLEFCIIEEIPEITEDQKTNCQHKCGLECTIKENKFSR